MIKPFARNLLAQDVSAPDANATDAGQAGMNALAARPASASAANFSPQAIAQPAVRVIVRDRLSNGRAVHREPAGSPAGGQFTEGPQ